MIIAILYKKNTKQNRGPMDGRSSSSKYRNVKNKKAPWFYVRYLYKAIKEKMRKIISNYYKNGECRDL